MKYFLIVLVSFMMTQCSFAKSPEVTAVYNREMAIPEAVKKITDPYMRQLTIEKLKERNIKCLMFLSDNKYAFIPDGVADENVNVNGDGSIYVNLKDNQMAVQRSILEKSFVVEQPFKMEQWDIMPAETKTINGKMCKKAVSRNDSMVVAWFCDKIPCVMGPNGYGGLPGLIMQLETSLATYTLTSFKANPTSTLNIVNNQKGNKISQTEYQRVRAEKLRALGASSTGGVQVIKMGQ